jgi:hypothetical protein
MPYYWSLSKSLYDTAVYDVYFNPYLVNCPDRYLFAPAHLAVPTATATSLEDFPTIPATQVEVPGGSSSSASSAITHSRVQS